MLSKKPVEELTKTTMLPKQQVNQYWNINYFTNKYNENYY